MFTVSAVPKWSARLWDDIKIVHIYWYLKNICTPSYKPHNSLRQILLIPLFYTPKYWGIDMFSKLSQDHTSVICSRARMQYGPKQSDPRVLALSSHSERLPTKQRSLGMTRVKRRIRLNGHFSSARCLAAGQNWALCPQHWPPTLSHHIIGLLATMVSTAYRSLHLLSGSIARDQSCWSRYRSWTLLLSGFSKAAMD